MSENSYQRRAEAAEKTVAVLKRRVHALYSGGAETAIHKQLAQAQERDAENRRKRAMMAARNEALQKHSEQLEAQVAERTRALRNILDNVTFGFLIVDAEGRIQEGFTASCHSLLQTDVREGMLLADALQCGSIDAFQLSMCVEQVFDDFMPEEVTLDQIPARHTLGERLIQAEGKVLRDEDGEVAGILFSLSDVTDLEAAREQARTNEMLIGILQQKAAFLRFLEDARSRLDACLSHPDRQDEVRRDVHTIKGNAASFGLVKVPQVAHEVESEAEITTSGLRQIAAALDAFVRTHNRVLGLDSGASIEVPLSEFEALQRMLNPVDAAGLARWGAQVVQRPVREMVGPLEAFVERLAERLDRQVDFKLEGGDVMVDPQRVGPVLYNLTHLLRNAMDHGLEAPHERGDKPERGTLSVGVHRRDEAWVLEVVDDGRGIDTERVVAKAIERGVLTPEEVARMSEQEKLSLVFLDGLSSKDEATDISGRGVGMAAVLHEVQRLGGQVDLSSVPGQGTRVGLWIPLPQALRQAA